MVIASIKQLATERHLTASPGLTVYKTHLRLVFAVGVQISPDLRQSLDEDGLREAI